MKLLKNITISQVDTPKISNTSKVSCKKMQKIIEIKYIQHKNTGPTIKKLDNDNILVLSTGQIKQVQHIVNRSQNKLQVSLSLKRLRDYINTNITDTNNCKWITLTYADNMKDTSKLYIDFKIFMIKLRRAYKDYKIEYIVAMEPQGRGAWHSHLLLIFNRKAPYIANSKIAQLWGQGFTKTNSLQNIDNIGAYLTAYLGDMELTEDNKNILNSKGIYDYNIKEVDTIENIKLNEPKKFIKRWSTLPLSAKI